MRFTGNKKILLYCYQIRIRILDMNPFHPLSTVDQLAAHLRTEIQGGGLSGEMPGVAQMGKKLSVWTTTVVAALEILKREGLLKTRGERRRCEILGSDQGQRAGVQVKMLLYERGDVLDEYSMEFLHRLNERGHHLEFAAKTLKNMRFNVKRISELVERTGGDAWVVQAGSREVLEWFSTLPIPSFAMFGRQSRLPMASLATLKSPAVGEALRRLVVLGHHRIVMLVREERRKPTPGLLQGRFLEELKSLGIKTGPFNLPDWSDDPQGLHRCLDTLFKHTRPTAIFLGEPALFFSTQQYLLRRGIVVPRDVSLISLDAHPSFAWFHPEVSHIRADTLRQMRRIVQWVDNVANGRLDHKETLIRAEFVEGGTIGPVS